MRPAKRQESQKDRDKAAFAYLVRLRDSGVTNMWGASPYLAADFGISEKEAGEILVRWIKSFDDYFADDNKEQRAFDDKEEE
jgi:hypothetical protein